MIESTIVLASPPAEVWPFITDTDRTNRLVLGEAATYRPIEKDAKSSARFVAATRAGGFSLEYEEAPFEWTVNERFSVYRKMRGGPLRSYTFGIALASEEGGGTTATFRLELEPRHWLLRPIAQIQGKKIVAGMQGVAKAIDAHLREGAPSPYLEPTSPVNVERLEAAKKKLVGRGIDERVVTAIVELVRSAPDADLVRVRPFELAKEKGLDGRELLRAFLHAVTLGIFELRWALICPSCRTANDQVTSLADIGDDSHCQLCDITYGIELDRAVEATFVPHPTVRSVTNKMFCIGGPWRTPHVVVQATIGARGERALDVPKEEARYRLFARGGAVTSLDVRADAPAEAEIVLDANGFSQAVLAVAPRGVVRVKNATDTALHVKIERLGYASLAATAHVVTTMSEFRRLFSRDLLKPSTPLKVASCAVLFSDLTGSTALYTKAGDAAAFRLVDDHFDVLRKAIDASGGTVVKTMGDAIMAAFVEPLACVDAAVECQRAFERFRKEHPYGADTGLKIGLFAGPCYVVTANEAIDYFGQTVNCASRVQHLAEAGEIVFEQDLLPQLREATRQALVVVEELQARVKGVDAPLRLVRTRLA